MVGYLPHFMYQSNIKITLLSPPPSKLNGDKTRLTGEAGLMGSLFISIA